MLRLPRSEPDRVFTDRKDNWDGRRCCLGHQCGRVSRRGDHRDPSTNQVGCQCRQSVDLSLGPTVFDRDILPLGVPPYRFGTLPFKNLNTTGREYRTWLINPTILLPRLFAELKRSAVPFRMKHFQSKIDFAELRENIIVNCTGYGAKAIMSDDNVIARRGHLVVLRKTLPKQFYFFSGGCGNGRIMYVFCRQNDIVVGELGKEEMIPKRSVSPTAPRSSGS